MSRAPDEIATQLNETLATPPVPDVGVHPNVPMRIYHTWDAASNSRLNQLRRSPAHLKAYLEEPTRDTPALLLGRAIHACVLEPDIFAEKYARGIEGDRRTKLIREAWAALELEHGPGFVLKPDDYDTCIAVRDAVWKKQAIKKLLGSEGDAELSAVWEDSETGVLCKARADRVSWKLAGGTIVDLKTTTDASLWNFERTIFNFGYHRQGAHYVSGFRDHLGVSLRHYSIIAVEKTPPYESAVYRLTEPALEAGDEQNQDSLRLYAHCIESGEWPGYPDLVQDIALPAWAWSRIEEEKGTL